MRPSLLRIAPMAATLASAAFARAEDAAARCPCLWHRLHREGTPPHKPRLIPHTDERAGHPRSLAGHIQPSATPGGAGYYVGGGVPLGHAQSRRRDEGTWGWDETGGRHFRRRVILGWSGGRKYQGGTGDTAPTGMSRPTSSMARPAWSIAWAATATPITNSMRSLRGPDPCLRRLGAIELKSVVVRLPPRPHPAETAAVKDADRRDVFDLGFREHSAHFGIGKGSHRQGPHQLGRVAVPAPFGNDRVADLDGPVGRRRSEVTAARHQRRARPSAGGRIAYHTYQSAAASPPSASRSRKNAIACLSYSPGGQLAGTSAPSKFANRSGPSISASKCSSRAASSSSEGVCISKGELLTVSTFSVGGSARPMPARATDRQAVAHGLKISDSPQLPQTATERRTGQDLPVESSLCARKRVSQEKPS